MKIQKEIKYLSINTNSDALNEDAKNLMHFDMNVAWSVLSKFLDGMEEVVPDDLTAYMNEKINELKILNKSDVGARRVLTRIISDVRGNLPCRSFIWTSGRPFVVRGRVTRNQILMRFEGEVPESFLKITRSFLKGIIKLKVNEF